MRRRLWRRGSARLNGCYERDAAEGRMSALDYGWIKLATRMRGRSNVMETCTYNFPLRIGITDPWLR